MQGHSFLRGPLQASGWWRYASMLGLAALIIALRRWPQFVHPDVWVEDGTQVIPSFVETGWLGLLVPVNGYLIVPAKLVSFAALSISFVHYALVSTLLATLVQAACVAAVASAPTMLPARRLCALAIVCVPTGTEVFALPLYTIWWTALMVVVALLWTGSAQWPRIAALTIGASSSPLITALAPLFVMRAVLQRRRQELVVCCLALALAAIQGLAFREQVGSDGVVVSLMHGPLLVTEYFGSAFYIKGWLGALPLGCLMLITLCAGLVLVPPGDRLGYGLLALVLAAVIVSASVRVPVTGTHPLFAGPRYFFYPTVTILWMLIWIAARGRRRSAAITAVALIGCYAPALVKVFDRPSAAAKQPWPQQVGACLAAESFTFEIQSGDPTAAWPATLSGEDCRRLAMAALLR